jgi:hypothetical protein
MLNATMTQKKSKAGIARAIKDINQMQLTVTSSVFDLDTMDEVSLIKTKDFQPAQDAKEAHQRLGGDAEKFLAVINEGLASFEKKALKNSSEPWNVQDEDGASTGKTFSGTPANSKSVNTLVLTLAKTISGYAKDANVEDKRASKESAIEMIRGNEAMKAGLKRSAVADSE